MSNNQSRHHHKDVIDFWFEEIEPKLWWKKDLDFDRLIEQRFLAMHTSASQCELFDWRESAEGRLAEIIVLDQFSRNIFRDQVGAFSSDALALCLAQEVVALGVIDELEDNKRAFVLMPYMHSESSLIHEQGLVLFEKYAPNNFNFEQRHKAIIDQFGRYPHRNKILSRESTKEEEAFLKQPGSSF